MPRYGMEFGFRDNPDTYRRARTGRGYTGESIRRYGSDLYGGYSGGARGGYGADFRRGNRPLTGMESNRYRGVYGSDFRAGQREWGPEHGGYRGGGRNWGGGMNPGRRG